MRRKQLFEFTDLSWWPDIFRSMTTDYLHVLINKNQPFSAKLADLSSVFRATNQSRAIDLCSGSMGPWLHLSDQLEQSLGNKVNVVLTDKFPNASAAMKVSSLEGIEYYPGSVDALAVPKDLKGVRTLFNALHHFKPNEAQKVISDAINNNQAIVVFELLQRNWKSVLATIRAPLALIRMMPFMRPFSFHRLLFTYVIPIAPITLLWDAAVSNVRCYTPKELKAMTQTPGGENYEWYIGTYHHNSLPVTYMIGYPRVELTGVCCRVSGNNNVEVQPPANAG